jgi:hypothetical protein
MSVMGVATPQYVVGLNSGKGTPFFFVPDVEKRIRIIRIFASLKLFKKIENFHSLKIFIHYNRVTAVCTPVYYL